MLTTTIVSIVTSLGSLALVVFLAVSNKRLRREKQGLEQKLFVQDSQMNYLKCQINNLVATKGKSQKCTQYPHNKVKGQ